MIYLIQQRPTAKQIEQMLETLESYIKLAVDVKRGILAGGGEMHADCESILLQNGSNKQIFGILIGIHKLKKSVLNL
jgi:Protein of unknown function (DUF5674)